MPEITQRPAIREVLARARVIAVLGAHDDPVRPAHYVPEYLRGAGYTIYPVNPGKLGMTLWGQPVLGSLAEVPVPVDILDVFRPSQALPGHLGDILAMQPLPRVVWFQLGIRNDLVARALVGAGMDVVQDRCTLADHRSMFARDTSQRAATASDRERYRQALLDKGGEVARKLADLMAGKNVRLSEVQGVKGLGDRHKLEDRLRAFLDHVNARRAALEADDGSFGRCEECSKPLLVAELDEMPWATHCPDCR